MLMKGQLLGINGMMVGGKRRITIPPDYAYIAATSQADTMVLVNVIAIKPVAASRKPRLKASQ